MPPQDEQGVDLRSINTQARASDLVGDEHVVEVFDLACEPSGTTWFAMELLAGKNVAELCLGRELSVGRALDITFRCARRWCSLEAVLADQELNAARSQPHGNAQSARQVSTMTLCRAG